MHYKNHDTDNARRRMQQQLIRMGWTKHTATECTKTCDNVKDFNTAYNTVQKEIKKWNAFADNNHLYYTNVRFHRIDSANVPDDLSDTYNTWCALYSQVKQIYQATEGA